MDEIVAFIVLWIVLYLINLVSKKVKKPDTGKKISAPAPPFTQTSQPPILDSAEPETIPSYLPEQQPDELDSEEEYIEEEEFTEQDSKMRESFKLESDQISPPVPAAASEEYINKKSISDTKPRLNLKQFIIWKEILDKPISLRNRHPIHKNRET